MMNVRTRFAPSPTGFIHLGNVWVAFLNWLYTRQHQGKLVLRIEDIDQTRSADSHTGTSGPAAEGFLPQYEDY